MAKRRVVIPPDDDFLRDVDPEDKERRRLAYEEAEAEAKAFEVRMRQEAKPARS